MIKNTYILVRGATLRAAGAAPAAAAPRRAAGQHWAAEQSMQLHVETPTHAEEPPTPTTSDGPLEGWYSGGQGLRKLGSLKNMV